MPTTLKGGGKPTAVIEIERLGLGWTEVARYDLTALSDERRVQVRTSEHYAPHETVERYSVQMGETLFPPVIVTRDGWLVDGNTRVAASLQRGDKFFPAYVLEVDYAEADTETKAKLRGLAATLNQQNGLALTAREVRGVVEDFVRLGWLTEQIGRAVGTKASVVAQVRRELAARDKALRIGVDLEVLRDKRQIRDASLRALGGEKVTDLNDIPFKELTTLAVDAGLNAAEIRTLAGEMRATGSDAAAIDHAHHTRVELDTRINERKLTGVGHPPESRMLRQRLGFVTKRAGNPSTLVEANPSVAGAHLDVLRAAVAVLNDVIRLQESR